MLITYPHDACTNICWKMDASSFSIICHNICWIIYGLEHHIVVTPTFSWICFISPLREGKITNSQPLSLVLKLSFPVLFYDAWLLSYRMHKRFHFTMVTKVGEEDYHECWRNRTQEQWPATWVNVITQPECVLLAPVYIMDFVGKWFCTAPVIGFDKLCA